jgi:hypothetical protein
VAGEWRGVLSEPRKTPAEEHADATRVSCGAERQGETRGVGFEQGRHEGCGLLLGWQGVVSREVNHHGADGGGGAKRGLDGASLGRGTADRPRGAWGAGSSGTGGGKGDEDEKKAEEWAQKVIKENPEEGKNKEKKM